MGSPIIEGITTCKKGSGKEIIISFEKLIKKIGNPVILDDLCENFPNNMEKEFGLLQDYFKAVHAAIRAKVEKKSSLLVELLEKLLLEGFHRSQIVFTKNQALRALSKVFDANDPNLEEAKTNWSGFSHTVETKEGLPVSVFLSENDKAIFFQAIADNFVMLSKEVSGEEIEEPIKDNSIKEVINKALKDIPTKKKKKEKKKAVKGKWIPPQ